MLNTHAREHELYVIRMLNKCEYAREHNGGEFTMRVPRSFAHNARARLNELREYVETECAGEYAERENARSVIVHVSVPAFV
jgi:hydrogenase maturation factor